MDEECLFLTCVAINFATNEILNKIMIL